MALHRDIHWIGRQWAVTGFGMQAIDQKLAGKFDIEISRLWDDGLLEGLREQKWLNAEDFNKGLAVARARFPAPPRQVALPQPEESLPPVKPSGPIETPQKPAEREKHEPPRVDAVKPPKPAVPRFQMRIIGCGAKFVRPWHVRIRR